MHYQDDVRQFIEMMRQDEDNKTEDFTTGPLAVVDTHKYTPVYAHNPKVQYFLDTFGENLNLLVIDTGYGKFVCIPNEEFASFNICCEALPLEQLLDINPASLYYIKKNAIKCPFISQHVAMVSVTDRDCYYSWLESEKANLF